MKTTPRFDYLFYILVPLLFALGLVLVIWQPHVFLAVNLAYWCLPVLTLILIVGPWGKIQLATHKKEPPRCSLFKWAGLIVFIELCLSLVYLAITTLVNHQLPIRHIAQPFAWQHSIIYLTQHFGGAPWFAYALIACGFGYLGYVKNQDVYFNTLYSVWRPLPYQTKIASTLNAMVRQGQNIVLSTTLGFLTLGFFSLLPNTWLSELTPRHYGFQLALMMVLLFSVTKFFRRIMNKLFVPERSVGWNFLIISVFVVIAIVFFTYSLNHLFSVNSSPPIFLWLNKYNTPTLWKLFSLTWWIGWTPIVAAYFARISRGRSIRQLLIGTIVPPLLLCLALRALPFSIHYSAMSSRIIMVLGLSAGFSLLALLLQRDRLPLFVNTYFSRNDHYKFRDPRLFLQRIVRFSIVIVFCYLPLGITAPALLMTLFSYFILILIFVAAIAVVWRLIFKK